MKRTDYVIIGLIIGLVSMTVFLVVQLQLAYSQTMEDKLKIAPLQNLCGPQYSPCAEIKHESNSTMVIAGDELIPSTQQAQGPQYIYNLGLWKVVDFYIENKGFSVNSVVYVDNEDFNSYRVILTKQ